MGGAWRFLSFADPVGVGYHAGSVRVFLPAFLIEIFFSLEVVEKEPCFSESMGHGMSFPLQDTSREALSCGKSSIVGHPVVLQKCVLFPTAKMNAPLCNSRSVTCTAQPSPVTRHVFSALVSIETLEACVTENQLMGLIACFNENLLAEHPLTYIPPGGPGPAGLDRPVIRIVPLNPFLLLSCFQSVLSTTFAWTFPHLVLSLFSLWLEYVLFSVGFSFHLAAVLVPGVSPAPLLVAAFDYPHPLAIPFFHLQSSKSLNSYLWEFSCQPPLPEHERPSSRFEMHAVQAQVRFCQGSSEGRTLEVLVATFSSSILSVYERKSLCVRSVCTCL